MHLYPYAYDEESQTYTMRENGLTLDDGSIAYAAGFCGDYLYEDYLNTIARMMSIFQKKIKSDH